MRSKAGRLGRGAVLGLLGLLPAAAVAQELRAERAEESWRLSLGRRACAEESCRFEFGRDAYRLGKGRLVRESAGEEVYRVELLGRSEQVLTATLSASGNVLAVGIARNTVDARGRRTAGRLGNSGGLGIHPSDVERQHRLELIRPKDGQSIKSLDLGAFKPEDLSLAESGELVLVVGTDLQWRVRELRVVNARSGKVELTRELASGASVELGTDGFRVAGQTYRLARGAGPSERTLLSRNPFSIAEFRVKCNARLEVEALGGRSLAIAKVQAADPELALLLASSLVTKLRDAGLALAERAELDLLLDELALQDSGLLVSEGRAELGRLVNAHYLVFAQAQLLDSTGSLTVRLVSVEQGRVESSCEVSCQDCRRDDLVEGLEHLVAVWRGGG
jgi:hypothetical protein